MRRSPFGLDLEKMLNDTMIKIFDNTIGAVAERLTAEQSISGSIHSRKKILFDL